MWNICIRLKMSLNFSFFTIIFAKFVDLPIMYGKYNYFIYLPTLSINMVHYIVLIHCHLLILLYNLHSLSECYIFQCDSIYDHLNTIYYYRVKFCNVLTWPILEEKLRSSDDLLRDYDYSQLTTVSSDPSQNTQQPTSLAQSQHSH